MRQDPGEEPDYRFSLANERTFLAAVRTALALLAAGVGVIQLLPGTVPRPPRLVIGLLLICLALLVAGTSYRRWRTVERAMRLGQPLPRSWVPLVLGTGLAAAVAVTAVLMLIG